MKMTLKNIVKEQIPPQVIITVIFAVMLAIAYGIWSKETTGTISLISPSYGTEVYIDGRIAGHSQGSGEKMSYNYFEGNHSVIISRGNSWPWEKNIDLGAKQEITLNPLLVQKDIKPIEIVKNSYSNGVIEMSSEYKDTLALFDSITIRQDVLKPLETTRIANARSADFFPGRTDVLLVAVNDGIFAVETGATTPRNFQPVYKGISPLFVLSNNTLIIKDDDSLYRISGLSN